jgi:hypothetical protein
MRTCRNSAITCIIILYIFMYFHFHVLAPSILIRIQIRILVFGNYPSVYKQFCAVPKGMSIFVQMGEMKEDLVPYRETFTLWNEIFHLFKRKCLSLLG